MSEKNVCKKRSKYRSFKKYEDYWKKVEEAKRTKPITDFTRSLGISKSTLTTIVAQNKKVFGAVVTSSETFCFKVVAQADCKT